MTSERFGGEHAAQTGGVHEDDVIKTASCSGCGAWASWLLLPRAAWRKRSSVPSKRRSVWSPAGTSLRLVAPVGRPCAVSLLRSLSQPLFHGPGWRILATVSLEISTSSLYSSVGAPSLILKGIRLARVAPTSPARTRSAPRAHAARGSTSFLGAWAPSSLRKSPPNHPYDSGCESTLTNRTGIAREPVQSPFRCRGCPAPVNEWEDSHSTRGELGGSHDPSADRQRHGHNWGSLSLQ
jgi:hypothetical protein